MHQWLLWKKKGTLRLNFRGYPFLHQRDGGTQPSSRRPPEYFIIKRDSRVVESHWPLRLFRKGLTNQPPLGQQRDDEMERL